MSNVLGDFKKTRLTILFLKRNFSPEDLGVAIPRNLIVSAFEAVSNCATERRSVDVCVAELERLKPWALKDVHACCACCQQHISALQRAGYQGIYLAKNIKQEGHTIRIPFTSSNKQWL
eukprot:2360102-Amphidinium_carterae.1